MLEKSKREITHERRWRCLFERYMPRSKLSEVFPNKKEAIKIAPPKR